MSCYHPLKGYQFGTTDTGKPAYKVVSYDTILYDSTGKEMEYQVIPCGKGIGCRLAYTRMWADRCIAEATRHDSSYFVTLTYDNDHLPHAVDPETGEIFDHGTLVKRDCQLFMKRLRKNYSYDNKIRFFLAGEYGSTTARPHYHVILFGLVLDDLKLYSKTALGFNLYNSDWLSAIWGLGHVVIADVTWETCAYTARYILKKQSGGAAQVYDIYHIEKEFTLMSRKPGIARDFYEDNKLDYLRYGEINISTPKGGRKVGNIKYFDKLLEVEYPEDVEIVRDKCKKRMEVINAIKLTKTDKSYLEMLETEESVKKAQIRKLPRKEI